MGFIDFLAKKIPISTLKLTLKRKLAISFLVNPIFQRWAIAIILCLVLSIIISPPISIFSPQYRVGSISSKDVKADRDFLVEDQESTKQKKDDAVRNVKSVYVYNSNIPATIKEKVVKAFYVVAEYINNITKKNSISFPKSEIPKIKRIFEAKADISLNEEGLYNLDELFRSPDLQQKFHRLIVSFYENKYITDTDLTKDEKERGIIIHNQETKDEIEFKDISQIINIKDIGTALSKTVNVIFSKENPKIRRSVFSIATKLIEPNLFFSKEITEKKKLRALEGVKPVLFQVQKNEMIVREGEKLTPIDVSKLDAYYKSSTDNKFSSLSVFLGIFFTTLFLTLILYFWRTRNWLKISQRSNVDLLVFGLVAILQILVVKIGIFMAAAINRAFPFLSEDTCFFAIPFAMGSMIIAILINRNVALIMSVLTSFLIGILFEEKFIFPLYCFLGSVAASYKIVNSRHRSAFLKVGIFLGVMNMAAIFCFNLLSGNIFNNLFLRMLTGFAGGILTGILVAGITPIFETSFGFMTDIKLLELANLNQPLFQRMIIEAPGTYHHSIVVGSLVEAASEAIGANSLLAKVSAYYHDIGKLKKPQYFIENQSTNENKHHKLSPKMSSLIIISHVKEGCELAAKFKLGRQITNIIRESHGTSIVSYFYDKAKKDKDESIRSLPESDFRYPGPKPQTKEAGLVMLGDVVEASSRTLNNPTPARIRSLVRERIERVYTDGQLDECELTLKNLNTIAETFTRILNGIFHHRIDYPEQMAKDSNGKKEHNENTN